MARGPSRSGAGRGTGARRRPRVADTLARPGADLACWAVRVRRLSVIPMRRAHRPGSAAGVWSARPDVLTTPQAVNKIRQHRATVPLIEGRPRIGSVARRGAARHARMVERRHGELKPRCPSGACRFESGSGHSLSNTASDQGERSATPGGAPSWRGRAGGQSTALAPECISVFLLVVAGMMIQATVGGKSDGWGTLGDSACTVRVSSASVGEYHLGRGMSHA